MRNGLWLAGAVACLGVGADIVSVNAEAGKSKTDLLVRSGETAVSVNAAPTAGRVRLNALNSYTGGTELKGGLLDVQTAADGVQTAETGTGPLTLSGGTFRYAGPAGAEWKTSVSNAAPNGSAVVWQVDNDLVVSGDVGSPSGAFVKTGTGMLTLTAPFTLASGTAVDDTTVRKQMADLSPDHAPTKGFSNATFLEGTTIIDPGYPLAATAPTTNVLATAGWTQIGGYTTVDGVEKSAVLEQRSGVTYTGAGLNIGVDNGKVGQAGEPPVSGLRLTGGRFLVGKTGTSATYMGAKNVGNASHSHSFLDISSNNRFITKGFYACQNTGSVCDVHVHDGGYLYGLDGNYTTGSSSSSAASTNNLVVEGEGSWISFQNFVNDSKNGGLTTNLRLADGAVMEMRYFTNTAKGKLHLVFDGGIWRHRNNAVKNITWPSSITSAKIGPGGLIVYHNGGSDLYPVIWDKGLEPLDDSGTDGGVSWTQGGATPPCLIRAVNTYCGPTVIEKIRVELGGNGRLPETTALRISTNGGGLIVSNGVQTVRSFHFGTAALNGAASSPMLGFTKGSRLEVTDAVVAGPLASPQFWIFEEAGPTNMLTNGLFSRGVHTFVTAPKASASALMDIAARLTFPYKPDAVDYAVSVVTSGERAELRVEVTDAGTPPTASSGLLILPTVEGDSTLTPTAEQVASANTILTNPRATGAGTVDLGALVGFAAGGTLRTGSGRTEVADLSFVDATSDLVLGPGTLAYTGASAAIPGLAVESGACSSVLDIPNADTTLTISDFDARAGGFTKMGAGTLHLGGTGSIVLTRNSKDNGTGNGVAANGDGPTTGYRAVNVNGGVLSIGTVGDPADAPNVSAPNDFSIGSQSHRDGSLIQTAGELVMNNGVLDIASYFYLGYYSAADTVLSDTVCPTLTQNGGYIHAERLRLYQDGNTTKTSRAAPRVFIHGGTNEIDNVLTLGYQAKPADFDGRASVVVDGGLLRVGNNVYGGYASGTVGADFTITGAGRVEVQNVFYPAYKNTSAENTFRLVHGGTLLSRGLDGAGTKYPLTAYFDGGVYAPYVNTSDNSYFRNMQKAYLGVGGLTVDLSHQTDLNGVTDRFLTFQQSFKTDPSLEEVSDGGLVFTGAGTACLWIDFANSSFRGAVVAQEGARLIAAQTYQPESTTFIVKPTARFSDYKHATPTQLGSLTLGEAGATEPTYLEIVGSGAIVKGTLSILSPVAIATRGDNHDLVPSWTPGVYTALVYNASNADVDLSKFMLPAEAPARTFSVRQIELDAGDYAGYKAVVVTLAEVGGEAAGAEAAVWTSTTTGGDWSNTANWQNVTAAPNGISKGASFKNAEAVGVPVTLDAPVTLGALAFESAVKKNGYTLSGAALTLGDTANRATVDNVSGTNAIAQTAVTGDTAVHAAIGTELRLDSVTGTGDLQLNENSLGTEGQVTAHIESTYSGSVKTGAGRVALDSLAFAQRADQLTLGAGTLLYTGADPAEIGGLRVSAGKEHAAIFEHEADITVDSLTVSGTSAFLKRGSGELRVHGTDSFKPNTYVNNKTDNNVRANGDTPSYGLRCFTVATGRVIWGEQDDPDNAPVYAGSADVNIGGATSKGDATLEINNGTFTEAGTLYTSYYTASVTPRPTYTFRLNGGTFKSKNITGAYNWSSAVGYNTAIEVNGGRGLVTGNVILSRNTASKPAEQTARWMQNDGVFGVGGNFYVNYWATNTCAKGLVDLNGGTLAVTGIVVFARAGKNTQDNAVDFRLNGGRLEVNAITQTVDAANTCFYGNGGTLAPIGITDAGGCFGAVGKLYASTNGLVVDTSILAGKDKDYTISLPILHDPDAPAIDGGVTKLGAGLLTLSGANTFTGPLTVAGGTLRLRWPATVVPTLAFAGGTLDAVAPVEAGTLTGMGVCQGALTVTGALVPDVDAIVNVTGDFTLASTAKVDLTRYPAASLDYGDVIPLVAALGNVSLPAAVPVTEASVGAHVSGQKFRLKLSVGDDHIVYGTLASSGTMIILR